MYSSSIIGTFTILYSNVDITDTYLLDNIGEFVNHGITLITSNLVCSNITLTYEDEQFLRR